MITLIVTFVVGFIVGILVGRNNAAKVNRAVEDAVELYEKAQEEIAELKAKAKKLKRLLSKINFMLFQNLILVMRFFYAFSPSFAMIFYPRIECKIKADISASFF